MVKSSKKIYNKILKNRLSLFKNKLNLIEQDLKNFIKIKK